MFFHLLFSLGGRSISPVVWDVFALVMKCSHIMIALSSAWCSMIKVMVTVKTCLHWK